MDTNQAAIAVPRSGAPQAWQVVAIVAALAVVFAVGMFAGRASAPTAARGPGNGQRIVAPLSDAVAPVCEPCLAREGLAGSGYGTLVSAPPVDHSAAVCRPCLAREGLAASRRR